MLDVLEVALTVIAFVALVVATAIIRLGLWDKQSLMRKEWRRFRERRAAKRRWD